MRNRFLTLILVTIWILISLIGIINNNGNHDSPNEIMRLLFFSGIFLLGIGMFIYKFLRITIEWKK